MKRNRCGIAVVGGSITLLAFTLSMQGVMALGPTFSIDYQGPTAGAIPGAFTGVLDGFGVGAIDEGSILTTALPGPAGPNPPAAGPLSAPGIMVGSVGGAPGSILGGLGLMPGAAFPFPVELDALSYGRDSVQPIHIPGGPAINVPFFSVDEFAVGVPSGAAPDVFSEGAAGMLEAAADIFAYFGPYGVGPGPVFSNMDILDGNGLAPFGGPGTGLIEPNPPSVGNNGGDEGDNLDAVDLDSTFNDVAGLIYFSLDSNFPDPLEVPPGGGPPPNTGTAGFNGFVGGDVLVTFAGGAPGLYAPATALGLDMTLAGQDSDDLDALALMDNGDGVPEVGEPGSGLDEILFSVRRGSAVIGSPDSLFGMPIEEGDILTVPLPTALGGVSPFPQIFIAAEALGLTTVRSGTAVGYGVPNPIYGDDIWADDLDALDVFERIPEPSCMLMMLVGLTTTGCLRQRRTR